MLVSDPVVFTKSCLQRHKSKSFMRNLNFLFVSPKVTYGSEMPPFPYGLACVTAYVRKLGFNVYCLDLNFGVDSVETQLQKEITQCGIDVVCVGGMSVEFHAINEVLDVTKKINPTLITVVGGPIIISDPQLALDNMKIDYGVRGEGEHTMAELAKCLCEEGDLLAVAGLVYKDSQGNLVSTKEREAIADLDALPMPDYEGFGFERYLLMKPNSSNFQILDEVREANIITSRSCPFSCTFCYHPLGKKYRQHSMDCVFHEIDFLIEKYRINAIVLMDDLFSVKKERMLEFAARIAPYHIPWVAQLRVGDVTPELLSVLKASGLAWISYGVESIDDNILISMRKKITSKQINHALKITRDAKIGLTANLLFGDPQETEESFENCFEWWKNHPEYDVNFGPVLTIPDASIYQLALKRGLIKDKLEFIKNRFPVINLTKMPDLKFNMLLSKITLCSGDWRYKVRGKVLESHKTHVEHGINYYSITVQCPECSEISVYNNFHMHTPKRYFSILCKSCLRRHHIDTLKSFPDDFPAGRKIKFITAYLLKDLYLRAPVVRYFVEKVPFVKAAIMRFRRFAVENR